jgi:hypothetical protein
MHKQVVTVMDWQTRTTSDLPRFGEDSWIKWLISEGYELIDKVKLWDNTINLYKTENNIYAVYNPPFAGLDIECLLINIVSEENAYTLIYGIEQKLYLFILEMRLLINIEK